MRGNVLSTENISRWYKLFLKKLIIEKMINFVIESLSKKWGICFPSKPSTRDSRKMRVPGCPHAGAHEAAPGARDRGEPRGGRWSTPPWAFFSLPNPKEVFIWKPRWYRDHFFGQRKTHNSHHPSAITISVNQDHLPTSPKPRPWRWNCT